MTLAHFPRLFLGHLNLDERPLPDTRAILPRFLPLTLAVHQIPR